MAERAQMDLVLSLPVDPRGFVSERDRDDFFRQQLALPENSACFDCGFAHPKWTSVSFAIYLCLNCSGKHRQMGSHLSFVRSVDMDRFTRDQLVRLALGGNGEFSAFLYAENLLQRPLNYANEVLLSYRARLDAELARAKGAAPPGPEAFPVGAQDTAELGEQAAEAVQPPGLTLEAAGSVHTESRPSSLRDDAEKLNAPGSEAFGDLLDLGTSSGEAPRPAPKTLTFSDYEEPPSTPTQKAGPELLHVFDRSKSSHTIVDPSKFDIPSDQMQSVSPSEKSEALDSPMKLDFSDPPSARDAFEFRNANLRHYFSQRQAPPWGARGRFSSRPCNFDFENFEKQNTLETSPTASPPAQEFPVQAPAPVAAAPSKTPSAPPLSAPANPRGPVPPFLGNPLDGAHAPAAAPLAGAGLSGKPEARPDVSQFEGKTSISSDAFFGNAPAPAPANQVSPNRLAFGSDDYFGRPGQQFDHPSNIEDQALQNLNELRDNIASAINRGTVLLEKAKNWIYTNYNQY